MSNEISHKADAQHGDEIATETETKIDQNTANSDPKEPKEGKRTVSFNRDVHVKRFGECWVVGTD